MSAPFKLLLKSLNIHSFLSVDPIWSLFLPSICFAKFLHLAYILYQWWFPFTAEGLSKQNLHFCGGEWRFLIFTIRICDCFDLPVFVLLFSTTYNSTSTDRPNWSVGLTFTLNIHKGRSIVHLRHDSQTILRSTCNSKSRTCIGNNGIFNKCIPTKY